MIIECNEINQTINQLKTTFQTCKTPSNKDLVLLVDLIAAVNTCANGGANYNTLITETYEGPTEINIPVNFLHSYTLAVMRGSVEYNDFIFPKGTVRNVEFTNLNQTAFKYIVNPGAKVMFEYLIEDNNG